MDFTMEFNWIQNRTYMLPLPTNDSQIHAAIHMKSELIPKEWSIQQIHFYLFVYKTGIVFSDVGYTY